MTLSDHQFCFIKDVAKLINFAVENGFKVTGKELLRTPEQQKIYFETGKSKTLNSMHLKGLAIDLAIFKGGIYLNCETDWETIKVLGDFWESLNPLNRWGGDFNKNDKLDGFLDMPHFERYV